MEIIVKGESNGYFTPDEVKLNINFNIKGQTYEEVLTKGTINVEDFINKILLNNGFNTNDLKTRNIIIKEEEKYDEITKSYIKNGYSFNQETLVKFDYNKEKIFILIEEISKLENAPSFYINFGVKNTNECRNKILASAYKDAEIKASAIATVANKTLKECIKIDFKPFENEYISPSNFDSKMLLDSQTYKTSLTPNLIKTFTPEEIEIRETLYCLWITE